MWPLLLAKAVAKLNGGYDTLTLAVTHTLTLAVTHTLALAVTHTLTLTVTLSSTH